MKSKSIDLNSDLGEGYNDLAIMPYISSCNIACGGHTGDLHSVEKTVLLAKEHKLAIGAHPSYPDRDNFGRLSLDIPIPELLDSITKQIQLVLDVCNKNDCELKHVKLHGALYNDMAKDKALSTEVLSVIKKTVPDVSIYALSGSKTIAAANKLGLTVKSEVFADRAYESSSELRSRALPGAVLTDLNVINTQLDGFLKERLTDIHGNVHEISADTICLHSDTPQAALISKSIYEHLTSKHVRISAT